MHFQNTVGFDIRKDKIHIVALKPSLKKEQKVFTTTFSLEDGLSADKKVKLIGEIVNQFIDQHKLGDPELFLSIPRERVVVRKISLPSAVKENLRTSLGYEMQKYVPMPADEVYFDYLIIEDDSRSDIVRLLMFVIKKDDLNDYLALSGYIGVALSGIQISSTALSAWLRAHPPDRPTARIGIIRTDTDEADISIYRGYHLEHTQVVRKEGNENLLAPICKAAEEMERTYAQQNEPIRWLYYHEAVGSTHHEGLNQALASGVQQLTAAGTPVDRAALLGAYGLALQTPDNQDAHINLVPGSLRRKPSRFGIYTLATLIVLTVLAGMGWLASHFVQQRMQMTAIDTEISRLAAQVETVDRLSSRIRRMEEQTQRINALRQKKIPLLQVLEELSSRIPDDTWIQDIRTRPDGLQIDGFSNSASELLPILEDSPLFKDAVFVSTITKTKDGKERFRLGLTYQ